MIFTDAPKRRRPRRVAKRIKARFGYAHFEPLQVIDIAEILSYQDWLQAYWPISNPTWLRPRSKYLRRTGIATSRRT